MESIQSYIDNHDPPIYLAILTPCYGGNVNVNFVESLLQTKELFTSMNLKHTILFCHNDSLVTRARNSLVASALSITDPHPVTHILFIDADLRWKPVDIIKLLMANKPLVGGLYPLKAYRWDRFFQKTTTKEEKDGDEDENKSSQRHISSNPNPNPTSSSSHYSSFVDQVIRERHQYVSPTEYNDKTLMRCRLVDYNANFLGTNADIENNLMKIKLLPTGFMMIERQVFTRMMEAFPETKYNDDLPRDQSEWDTKEKKEAAMQRYNDRNKYMYAFFDTGVVRNSYYSEDWWFSHRWRQLGGDVWAHVSIDLTHYGTEGYVGSFLTSINIPKDTTTTTTIPTTLTEHSN